MLIINILIDSLRPVDNIIFPTLKEKVVGAIELQVISKVARFNDLALFETPDLLNLLKLAERSIKKIPEVVYLISEGITGSLILIPAVLLSGSISWWIPLLLILSAIPSKIVTIAYTRKSWSIEEDRVDVIRQMDSTASMMLNEAYAKEMRLLSLQNLAIAKWEGLYHYMLQSMNALRWRGAMRSFFWSLIEGIGTIVPYVYLTIGVTSGNYSIGDLALYSGSILQIRFGMNLSLGTINNIYGALLAIRPIFYLLNLEPSIADGTEAITAKDRIEPDCHGIQIKELAFAYPGSERPTIRDFNLTIHPGEKIAIVGENGSGKTTLAKLLCRFYDPQQGSIAWNDRDFRSLSLSDLRSHLAVIMQDYAHFPATVRENIGWGWVAKLSDDEAIETALAKVGMMSLFNPEAGLETPLSKQFDRGIDLSGGQWQRIAIARVLLRLSKAELLIFDEPTAAIDPQQEHEIHDLFREITTGRMSIIISHRLGLARMADRIIVMEKGRIIEEGSHERLMLQSGKYHQMFVRQMSQYR